jgi:hypothetical protein
MIKPNFSVPLTLGGLIKQLEPFPLYTPVFVCDFNYTVGDLVSYRAHYQYLAIDPKPISSFKEASTVEFCLKIFREAEEKIFVGYKGGEFLMTRETPVFISPYASFIQIYTLRVERFDWLLSSEAVVIQGVEFKDF